MDFFLFEGAADFGCELIEQRTNRVVVQVAGIERQHFAGEDRHWFAVVGGVAIRARVDNFAAGEHARKKRLSASIALPHPAMRRTDRLFEIVDPAAGAIAGAQAQRDLELAPRTFATGKRREALHYSYIRRSAVRAAPIGKPAQDCLRAAPDRWYSRHGSCNIVFVVAFVTI